MHKPDVIAVIDAGKTNKKLLLFDAYYNVITEETLSIPETRDEDGFPCEDIRLLKSFVTGIIEKLSINKEINWKAINFSAYGASLVYLDQQGHELTPLYNYLKPFPRHLQEYLVEKYGGAGQLGRETASPLMGSLNAALQLFRIKNEQPEIFNRMRYALHLPQYLSWLVNNHAVSDITSIGCHTLMWDFGRKEYHQWITEEGICPKLAPVTDCNSTFPIDTTNTMVHCGIGLHDSSAALIPYLVYDESPFILVSTGTWNITLNPFNSDPLKGEEVAAGCLYYLSYTGKPVKASRLFAGRWHDHFKDRIADHFQLNRNFYRSVAFDPRLATGSRLQGIPQDPDHVDLSDFTSAEEAYHFLVSVLVDQQLVCIGQVINDLPLHRVYVDGGFSRNEIFMQLLARRLPGYEVFAANIHQATALGAALAIHDSWNPIPVRKDLIDFTHYFAES